MFFDYMAKLHQNIKRFLQIKVHFDGKAILQWEHHTLSIEACDAIRPELNCFISMIISVDTLCGFAPLVEDIAKFTFCEDTIHSVTKVLTHINDAGLFLTILRWISL